MTDSTILFVGSLQRPTPYFESADGDGITTFRLDHERGTLEKMAVFAGVDNPSFLAIHPSLDVVYAASEVYGWNEGIVTALRFDRQSGQLQYINRQSTRGSITAHVSVDRTGRHVFATNYAHEKWPGHYGVDWPRHAVCVLPVGDEGDLGAATGSVQHHGTGPVPVRQDEPHPHCAIASPDNRFVLVADLGIDAVMSYRLANGELDLVSRFDTAPGAGPRHLKFSPRGDVVYLINELDSTICSLAYAPDTGMLSLLQTVSTLPEGRGDTNRCSEIVLSPDGLFAYAANRGHDTIATIALGETGTMTRIANTPSGGQVPRNIALDPSGRFLFCANQESGTLSWFRRDQTSGAPDPMGSVAIGTPMCVAMTASL